MFLMILDVGNAYITSGTVAVTGQYTSKAVVNHKLSPTTSHVSVFGKYIVHSWNRWYNYIILVEMVVVAVVVTVAAAQ